MTRKPKPGFFKFRFSGHSSIKNNSVYECCILMYSFFLTYQTLPSSMFDYLSSGNLNIKKKSHICPKKGLKNRNSKKWLDKKILFSQRFQKVKIF